MSIALRVVVALSVAATAVALVPGGAAGDTSPTVTVTVDGTAVADGNTTLIETDPTVGVDVDANRTIRVVSVRVDGTTERRYTPNTTSIDESVDVSLRSGEHSLEVVVKTGTDGVTTHSVTVTKDAERPYVRYTSPFETDRYAPPPDEVTVNRSRIVLGGTFDDVTGVTHFRVVRTTDYEVAGGTKTDRDVYATPPKNGSFEQPLFLGVGTNNVTAQYYDRLNHVRKHRFRMVVEDGAPPSLYNLSATRPSSSSLRIRGEATDNGQLRSVSVDPADQAGTTYLLSPGNGAADPARRAVVFDETVSLQPGATSIVVNATDTAGNSVERTVTVRRTVAPELRLDRMRTSFDDDGRLLVAGGATDGEIADATVETVDPESGDVVDIASVHDGRAVTDLTFERRLATPDGRAVTARLRVIDSTGTEHVVALNRTRSTGTRTATPTSTSAPRTATPAAVSTTPTTPAAGGDEPTNGTTAGLTLPLVGVTVPVPDPLTASVTLPVPVIGPVGLPVAPLTLLVAVGVGVVVRRR